MSSFIYVTCISDLEFQLANNAPDYLYLEIEDYHNNELSKILRLLNKNCNPNIYCISSKTFLMVKHIGSPLKINITMVGSKNLENLILRRVYLEERLNKLTEREKEILKLKAKGYTQEQIADELIISRRTVNTHFEKIYKKLDVNNSISAVIESIKIGIVVL